MDEAGQEKYQQFFRRCCNATVAHLDLSCRSEIRAIENNGTIRYCHQHSMTVFTRETAACEESFPLLKVQSGKGSCPAHRQHPTRLLQTGVGALRRTTFTPAAIVDDGTHRRRTSPKAVPTSCGWTSVDRGIPTSLSWRTASEAGMLCQHCVTALGRARGTNAGRSRAAVKQVCRRSHPLLLPPSSPFI